MRLPKTVDILGDTYRLIRVPGWGAEYNRCKKTIGIGRHSVRVEGSLLHEIIEILLAELNYMDYKDDLGRMARTVVMNHIPCAKGPIRSSDEFGTFVTVLRDTIKRNKLQWLF